MHEMNNNDYYLCLEMWLIITIIDHNTDSNECGKIVLSDTTKDTPDCKCSVYGRFFQPI